jgi:hypothetical protein
MSHFCPLEKMPNLVRMQRKHTFPFHTFSFISPSSGRLYKQTILSPYIRDTGKRARHADRTV